MDYKKYLVTEGMDSTKLHRMLFKGVTKNNVLQQWFNSINQYVGSGTSQVGDKIIGSREKTVAEEIWKRSNIEHFYTEVLDVNVYVQLKKNWKGVASIINKEWTYDKVKKEFVKKV